MISLNQVGKKFGDKIVIHDFTEIIKKGEFVAIIGKSGSGKSTLLNMIGMLERPSSGSIEIDGVDVTKASGSKRLNYYRHKISYLFQNYALIDNASVEENMEIAVKYVKGNKNELIEVALKRVGLEGMNKQEVFSMSGGEQQRLAIARLLVKPSEIILADEPTGNLDDENSKVIFDLLKNINMEDKKTVIVVTHNHEYLDYFDRVLSIGE